MTTIRSASASDATNEAMALSRLVDRLSAVERTGHVHGDQYAGLRFRALSTVEATLASTEHGFQIGPSTGLNLRMDTDETQVVNNGAAAPYFVQPHGGLTQFGAGGIGIAGGAAQFPVGVTVAPSTHATSRRAEIRTGSIGWLQDVDGSGVLDFGIFSHAASRLVIRSNAAATTLALLPAGGTVGIGNGSPGATGSRLAIGNDSYFEDINVADAIALVSTTNSGAGRLYFGNTSANGYIRGNATQDIVIDGANIYLDAANIQFRARGGAGAWGVANTNGLDMGARQVAAGKFSAGSGAENAQAGSIGLKCDMDSAAWNWSHIVITSGGSTSRATQIGFHANNVAPIIAAYGSAEQIHIRNSAGSGYAPIAASAFNISSSLDFKQDVERPDTADLLNRFMQVRPIRYRYKERPQWVSESDRFTDINQRWTAKGRTPLTCPAGELIHEDHDCTTHECSGDDHTPCAQALNDSMRYGLAAEEVGEAFPDAVWWDDGPDGAAKIAGIDSAQIDGILWGALRQAINRISALEERL